MYPKFQIVKGFAGATVNIQQGDRVVRIDLNNATDKDLARLAEMKHPAVKAAPKEKAPKEKTAEK